MKIREAIIHTFKQELGSLTTTDEYYVERLKDALDSLPVEQDEEKDPDYLNEEWRFVDILGFSDGMIEASNHGRVRSWRKTNGERRNYPRVLEGSKISNNRGVLIYLSRITKRVWYHPQPTKEG